MQDEPNGSINRKTDRLSAAPATGYHPAYDRSPPASPNPWNVGPPDGKIRGVDILMVVNQYNHDCA